MGRTSGTKEVTMAYSIKHRSTLLPLAIAATLLAGSASFAGAQTTSPAPAANAVKASGSLQMSHNDWRSTKLDGANVYNDQGTSIGTIDDMLLDSAGKVSNVVLSVGGFLGMGSKYVEVQFSKLKFEPSKGNPASNASTTTTANNHDYSIVLPGVTKDSLQAMTAFTY
jgi:sporulation protein YlmC with PRC-barrel domain